MYRIMIIAIFIIASISSLAQKSKAKLTEFSVVKDTSGNVYPYSVWKPLMMSSAISIYPETPEENSAFIIRRLTEEQEKQLLQKMPKPRESAAFKTGDRFGNFNEIDINGNKFKAKDLKGKVVVVNFWFINCPPCRMEMPDLNNMVTAYATNQDVVFLGIALDKRAELEDFLKTFPFKYNIIEDGRRLATSYRVSSFPTHLVIDRQGKITFHTMGLAKNTVHWIKKSIDEALQAPVANATAANK